MYSAELAETYGIQDRAIFLRTGIRRHYLHRGFFAAGFLQRQQLTVGIVSLLHDVLPLCAKGAGCIAICRIQQMTVHLDYGATTREQLHSTETGTSATFRSACRDTTCMRGASMKGQLRDIGTYVQRRVCRWLSSSSR